MAREVDAVIAGLKADARRQVAGLPAKRRAARARLSEAEQIRRFLAGEEKARLERGEITAREYRAYQEAMVAKLRRLGALETTANLERNE